MYLDDLEYVSIREIVAVLRRAETMEKVASAARQNAFHRHGCSGSAFLCDCGAQHLIDALVELDALTNAAMPQKGADESYKA